MADQLTIMPTKYVILAPPDFQTFPHYRVSTSTEIISVSKNPSPNTYQIPVSLKESTTALL